jgi:hypothetical protein
MIDYKNIAVGFINATRNRFGFSSPDTEKLAANRYETCLQCDTISDDKIRCDRDKGGCNCILYLKTRSGSECPKQRW